MQQSKSIIVSQEIIQDELDRVRRKISHVEEKLAESREMNPSARQSCETYLLEALDMIDILHRLGLISTDDWLELLKEIRELDNRCSERFEEYMARR